MFCSSKKLPRNICGWLAPLLAVSSGQNLALGISQL